LRVIASAAGGDAGQFHPVAPSGYGAAVKRTHARA